MTQELDIWTSLGGLRWLPYLRWEDHLGDFVPTKAGILNCTDGETELRSQQALIDLCFLVVDEVY